MMISGDMGPPLVTVSVSLPAILPAWSRPNSGSIKCFIYTTRMSNLGPIPKPRPGSGCSATIKTCSPPQAASSPPWIRRAREPSSHARRKNRGVRKILAGPLRGARTKTPARNAPNHPPTVGSARIRAAHSPRWCWLLIEFSQTSPVLLQASNRSSASVRVTRFRSHSTRPVISRNAGQSCTSRAKLVLTNGANSNGTR